MAAPVIDSVSPTGPISAPAGSKVTITVVGHDADTKTTTVLLQLKNDNGDLSSTAQVKVNWVDNMTLLATTDDGTPVSVSGLVATVG